MIYYPRCFIVIYTSKVFLTNSQEKTFRKVDTIWQQIQAQENETVVLPKIQRKTHLKTQRPEEKQLPDKIQMFQDKEQNRKE